jgi:multidrug efflux pump subunit AcrA (membrane-fusion protein)
MFEARSQSRIFREEAVQYQLRGSRTHGDVLRLSPRWLNSTYWLLIALLVAAGVYVVLGTANEYAAGAAVVRNHGRTTVAAVEGGLITEIAVRPGQRVEAGELLLRFNDLQDKIEFERAKREFNSLQINRLKNPGDATAEQRLATVRAQMEVAEKRLKERTIRAATPGVVRDVRVRPQQLIAPGDVLLTIAGGDDALYLIAILPGHYRPLLKAGNPLRLELHGFRYAYQHVIIDSVGNEIIGPNELRRFLGQDIADSVALQGASVIVQAHLPSRTFQANGRRHELHDGMTGTAEARVRSERILLTLVPGLKAAFGGSDE